MSYTVYDPFGEIVEIDSLEKADIKISEFKALCGVALKRIDGAVNLDDPLFRDLDTSTDSWNHNVEVIKQMGSDPQLLLEKKKNIYRRRFNAILEMTKIYLEGPPE